MPSPPAPPNNPAANLSKCPHCNAFSFSTKSARYGLVCGICGGPRLPSPLALEEKSTELAHQLRRQRAARGASTRNRAFSGILALGGAAVGAGLAAVGSQLGLTEIAVGAAAALPPLAGAAGLWWRSMTQRAEASTAEVAALGEGVYELMQEQGHVTVGGLSRELERSEGEVEQALAWLAAQDRAHSELTEHGELRFSRVAPARLRVAKEGDAGADGVVAPPPTGGLRVGVQEAEERYDEAESESQQGESPSQA